MPPAPGAQGRETSRIPWPEPPEVEARQAAEDWEGEFSSELALPDRARPTTQSPDSGRSASSSASASTWGVWHAEAPHEESSGSATRAGAAALDPFDITPGEPEASDPFGHAPVSTPTLFDPDVVGFEDWTGTTFHPMSPPGSSYDDSILAENVVEALAVEADFDPFSGNLDLRTSHTSAAANATSAGTEEPGPRELPPEPKRGQARITGTMERSKAIPSQRISAVSQIGQAVQAAVAGMSHEEATRAPSLTSGRTPGLTLSRLAEIEPPPTPKVATEAKPAPERIPGPGGKLTLDGATYTVMDPDEALERLLRTGDLPEYTYVHELDLGYVPSDWNNPASWQLRPPLHTRMVAQEEAFYIPRQGPNAPDCLAMLWPRRALKLNRCAFGTLNLNRAAFPLGVTITRCKVLYRLAAVRVRFDGRADFEGTTFPLRSTFYQLHASGGVTFDDCRFEGSTSFARAHIDGYTSLRKAQLGGNLDLSNAYLGAELDLREANVLGQTQLRGIRVLGALDLGHAGLHGPLDLGEARIEGSMRADQLACGSTATLERCRLGGDADFMHARFAETLLLAHARFRGEVRFGRCQFGGLLDGYRMEIDGPFDLTESIMHGDAVFATSRFQGLVRFNVDPLSRVRVELTQKAAEFRGLARFDHCVFSKPLVASATRFHGRVTFRRATFEESASLAEASFATGADFSNAFAGKELDLRNASVGGRLALDGMHVGGRTLLKAARFRALSLSEATLQVLTLERRQLFPDERDLRQNYADPEVPPFEERERHLPAKLFHYRQAVRGSGVQPSTPLSESERQEQRRARHRGGLDAKLKLEEGGARLVAFDKACEEFSLLKRSFAALGQREDEDWAYVLARRMQRARWRLAGRGVKPVDEALLAVEREIAALEEMRELVEAERVEHEKFPRELAQRRAELLATQAQPRNAEEKPAGRETGWPRLKELTLKAIRARLEPLQDKRERILDRLRSLEPPRPRTLAQRVRVPLAWKGRNLVDAGMDALAAYGTRPLRILLVVVFVTALFALFYTWHSFYEEAALPSEPHARAEQRALHVEPTALAGSLEERDGAGAALADPDAVRRLSLTQRFELYLRYSAGVMLGQGWRGDMHPRPGHGLYWLVVVQTVLGLTLLLLFAAAAIRRLLR